MKNPQTSQTSASSLLHSINRCKEDKCPPCVPETPAAQNTLELCQYTTRYQSPAGLPVQAAPLAAHKAQVILAVSSTELVHHIPLWAMPDQRCSLFTHCEHHKCQCHWIQEAKLWADTLCCCGTVAVSTQLSSSFIWETCKWHKGGSGTLPLL